MFALLCHFLREKIRSILTLRLRRHRPYRPNKDRNEFATNLQLNTEEVINVLQKRMQLWVFVIIEKIIIMLMFLIILNNNKKT